MGPAAFLDKILPRKWFLHPADEEGEYFEACGRLPQQSLILEHDHVQAPT